MGTRDGGGDGVEHLGQTFGAKKVTALEKARAAVVGVEGQFATRTRDIVVGVEGFQNDRIG